MEDLKYQPLGDTALRIEFGKEISEGLNKKIRKFMVGLAKQPLAGMVEYVPTYTTLTIFYNPIQVTYEEIKQKLIELTKTLETIDIPPAKVYEIPTLYGCDAGPDLGDVAKYNRLTESDVINIHSSREYLIYMMGFVPGFPYLGGMDSSIATPRLEKPRVTIPAGSVGIAGSQTGIYPLETPGGWRIIGLTPAPLYDVERDEPILLSAGNYVKFVPITQEQFSQIQKEVREGAFQVRSYAKET